MASKSIFVTFYLIVALFSCPSASLELVDQSTDVLVPQGGELSLQCSTDLEFTFCEWTQVESGSTCRITKDQAGSETQCPSAPRISFSLEPTVCGIIIPEVDRAFDMGDYKCSIVRMGDDNQAETVTGVMNVDIAMPASVRFESTFAAEEVISVKEGEMALVECHAKGGYPDPEVQVAMGLEEGVIDVENDVLLAETEGIADSRAMMDDGTVDLIKLYTFMPTAEDTGKFIKCEAVQYDSEDNLIFDSNMQSREIMVTYPPQPARAHLDDIGYAPGQDQIQVDVIFDANPVPQDNQAIWHMSPTGDMADAKLLEAGDYEEGKYDALPLNITGQEVIASLIIYNLIEEDASFTYTLQVVTDQGETVYPFTLQQLVMETTIDPESFESGEEPEVDASGVGAGTIAGN